MHTMISSSTMAERRWYQPRVPTATLGLRRDNMSLIISYSRFRRHGFKVLFSDAVVVLE